MREAATRQLQACGAAIGPPAACDVRLLDPDSEAPPCDPGGPPTLVLLAPEARERIDGLRAQGFAGYLIKPGEPA